MKRMTIVLVAAAICGCTSVTKLETIPTHSWNNVVEKGGQIYTKGVKSLKVEHAYFADCTSDGKTRFVMEVQDGRILSGWCLHPDGDQRKTVSNAQGKIMNYNYKTGDPVSHRVVSDGRLGKIVRETRNLSDFHLHPRQAHEALVADVEEIADEKPMEGVDCGSGSPADFEDAVNEVSIAAGMNVDPAPSPVLAVEVGAGQHWIATTVFPHVRIAAKVLEDNPVVQDGGAGEPRLELLKAKVRRAIP